MNHHFRSYSEHQQLAPTASAAGGFNTGNAAPQSEIRIHSDSKQSLDQLFNPTQTSVPLRNRNLPSSFFNPSVKTDGETNGAHNTNGNHHATNNFHSRSISFDQRGAVSGRPNFHSRTHSILAPMPRLDSNHSSHQSSHEFLNSTSNNNISSTSTNNNNIGNNNHSSSNNNVSSCQQQHGENIVSSTSTNNHNHQHHHLHSNSNGWPSAGNSIDDLSSPGWAGGRQQQQQPLVQPAPMQIVHQHHHAIMPEQAISIQPTAAARHQHQPQPTAPQQQPHQHQHQPIFYNAQAQAAPATNHVCPTHSLHSRSMSVQQQPFGARVNHGLHMRTHSTVAPLSSSCNHHSVASHHSSHQSSQEFLNNSSATSASAGTTGWSSSGCSTDDMSGTSSWPVHGHNHYHHHDQSMQHQQPIQQPPQARVQQVSQQPIAMDHQAMATCPTVIQHHNGHHHHHHHHIPMQVQHPQQAPQQLFYNV